MPWPSSTTDPAYDLYPGILSADTPTSGTGQDMLDMLPPWITGDNFVQQVQLALGAEFDLIENALAVVRSNIWPLLGEQFLELWEAMLEIPENPAGLSTLQRRARIIARLQRSDGLGQQWVAQVGALTVAAWSYQEYEAADPYGPPAYTVRITAPWNLSNPQAGALLSLLQVITPAHIAVQIFWGAGFLLDSSPLDIDAL